MKNQHTPGPWKVSESRLFEEVKTEILSAHHDTLAEVFAVKSTISQEGQANARLIAAAPDLLEALKQVTELAYELAMASPKLNPHVDKILPLARAAIAKAQGV